MATSSGTGAVEEPSPSADRAARSGAATGRPRWRRIAGAALAGGLLALAVRRRSLGAAVAATAAGLLSARLLGGEDTADGRTDPAASPDGRTGDLAAPGGTADAGTADGDVSASGTVTIDAPAEELSATLQDATQLDRVVGPVASVTAAEGDRHRYAVDGPLDLHRSWEMRLADDRSGEFVRWASVDGSALLDEWRVRLDPASGGRGTRVRLAVDADPPGGAVGRALLDRLAPVADGLTRTALDRLKGLVETGEVATTGGNPSGRGEGDLV